ncbi:MAG: 3'-5' exonuclease domain-containing protein 2 [Opitutales bacterium]|nr:3'-5' exonuclease domain-containing protein 2 [Opitutales bacterium]
MRPAKEPSTTTADESGEESTRRIDKETINKLPLKTYEGPIILAEDQAAMEAAVADLRKEAILGFDTESRPAFKKGENYGVSLLQLAGTRAVYLFQLSRYQDLVPLFQLLEDPAIVKAGVAIHDDIRKLNELHPFTAAGFIEIADITQKSGIVNTGLRSLTAFFLGFRISKRAQVSNWARQKLTPAQIQYAATDAWTSRRLYECCQQRGWV